MNKAVLSVQWVRNSPETGFITPSPSNNLDTIMKKEGWGLAALI